jgi:DNA-binding GntR family transcriptional regulator
VTINENSVGPRIYLSKSELVAAGLREMIMTGDLAPGVPLRQRDLADRFGVSPTPVREAIRMLESEGLIKTDSHKSSTVKEPDSGAAQDRYRIRAALEGLAANLAASKITDEDLAQLVSLNERLKDASLSDAEIRDINRQLHFHIYLIAGSPLLLSLMRLLWQSFPHGPQYLRPRKESLAEHRQLIEALGRRDSEAAQAITQVHILGAIPYVVNSPTEQRMRSKQPRKQPFHAHASESMEGA